MAVYRVVLRGTVGGQTQNTVRYWINLDATPDLQGFANEFGTAFKAAIAPLTSTDTIWNDLYISGALLGSLGTIVVPAAFPVIGTQNVVTRMPLHDAVLLRYSSSVLQYPRQNRNRISGFMETQVEGGLLTPASIASWQTVADALSGVYTTGGGWTPTLWSDEYQQSNLFTAATVDNRISTQRSRRVGVGG